MSSIYWKIGEKAVISKERVDRFIYYYAKFTALMEAYFFYTKGIDFLVFCGFF